MLSMISLGMVQDLYENKEAARKYAMQTEEYIHQQTHNDVNILHIES